MHTTAVDHMLRSRIAAAVLAALAVTGCSIDKQRAPSLVGPSEYGLSVTLTATPDVLPRDGHAVSVIGVTARDAEGKPVAGQRLVLDASAGTLSAAEVVTGSNGAATFQYTAPELNSGVSSATIRAVPVGTDAGNGTTKIVQVSLTGPGVPVPSFAVTPGSPRRFEPATLDAGATTVNGSACGAACTYTWTVGDEATLTGALVSHRFRNEGSYTVTLTVAGPGATTASTTRVVAVGAATAPTALFNFSPTNPRPGDTVFFNASGSTAAGGATIVDYRWDFGDGNVIAGPGATASNPYPVARTYVVRLTVTDSNGVTGTTTLNVTVAAGTT